MSSHDETLFLESLGDVAGSRTGNLDPGLGEDRTGDDDKGDVDDGVDRVEESVTEAQRGRHVVGDTTGSVELRGSFSWFPGTDELDQQVVREASVEHLADHEDVGCESRLQHDGHVGGVEETDRVRAAHATLAGGLDGDLDTEALEVDDRREDGQSGQ